MSNAAITWSYRQRTGSASTKAVLVALADVARDDNALKAFPCLQELCDRTELNRKTVIDALDELVKAGFVNDSGERTGRTGQIRVFQFDLGKSPKNGTVKESRFFHERVPKTDGKSSTFSSKSPKNGTRIPYNPSLTQKEPMISHSSLEPKIQELHDTYCSLIGEKLSLGLGEYSRESFWQHYLKAGFNVADLRLVMRHLKREIHGERRNKGCLRFSNLIQQLDRFEEELVSARAEERNRKPAPTPLQRVMEQARPTAVQMEPEAAQITARPVGDLISDLRRAAGMQ